MSNVPIPSQDSTESLVSTLPHWQTEWTAAWHTAEPGSSKTSQPFQELVKQQHLRNFNLWHEEDKARDPQATDTQIAGVKRRIDKFNQERNDHIERLDEFFLTQLHQANRTGSEQAPWNSETPGNIIDRLSILALKVYHMREQEERGDASSEHVARCKTKRETLERQRADLATALRVLWAELWDGKKQMKIYRQFKMYNDPSLNPAIYKATT